MKKIIFAWICILLLTAASFAQEYDYNDTESYKESDFYKNSDPAKWNYNDGNFDWSEALKNDKVYSEQKFYDNLPDNQYKNLDYNQVDYSKVKDHNKIDAAKYLADMKCENCQLDRGKQNLQFSKNKVTHPNGDSVSVPGSYPSGAKFTATESRIIVEVPEGTTSLTIPSGDKVTIDTKGATIALPDKTTVNGKLTSRDGVLSVGGGDAASINGYKIDNTVSQTSVQISIGKLSTAANSVSFEQGKVTARGVDFEVTSPESIRFNFYGKGGEVVVQDRFGSSLLKEGSKGEDVRELQRTLNRLGYRDENGNRLTEDGIFGPKTAYAVEQYQTNNGLGVDAKVGPETKESLQREVGPVLTVSGDVNFPSNHFSYVDGKLVKEPLAEEGPAFTLITDKSSTDISAQGKTITPVPATTPTTTEIKNPKTTDLKQDDDVTAVARLIFGEARGGTDELKTAVAYTVVNRVEAEQWWGSTPKEVAYKPYQYSAFNEDDPNRAKVMDPLRYENANVWTSSYSIARQVLANPQNDITNGATHYYDTSISTPSWARGRTPVKVIKYGNKEVRFYKLER